MPSSVGTSGSFAGNRPSADDRSIFFLFFLELEEVGLVLGLREFLGAIFAGDGDAEGELFAVDLVDSLGRLALGFFGAVFNDQVDGRERLGILVNFAFARVIHASDAGLDLFAVESPGRVDAFARRRPGSLKRLQQFGLRRIVALGTGEAKRSPEQGRQGESQGRRGRAFIAARIVTNIMMIPRKLTMSLGSRGFAGAAKKAKSSNPSPIESSRAGARKGLWYDSKNRAKEP